MNCKLCSALFQEFLENSLCEEVISELEDHMHTCKKCSVMLRTYTLTITLSQKLDPPCCVSTDKINQLKKILLERFFTKQSAQEPSVR